MIKKIGLKRLTFGCFVVFAVISFLSSISFAEDNIQPNQDNPTTVQEEPIFNFQDSEQMPEPDLKRLILRVFLMLGIILICIVALIYLLKVFMGNKQALFAKHDKYVQLIDRLNIESKKSVYLIKILDEILVVGAGTDSLTLLTKINDADKVQALSSKDFKPLLNLFSQRISENKGIDNVKNESH